MASIPIKGANKTIRVSRQPQYKRNRTSKPLTPLNQERTSQKPTSNKEKISPSVYPDLPQALPKALHEDLNSSAPNQSPVVLLVPAGRFLDTMDKENILSVPLPKESRVLNKTLSPICTPERFSNPLRSRFQSPLPVICTPIKDGDSKSVAQSLSVKDALAIINSDLYPVSPPNACSSLNLADSLDSLDLSIDGKAEKTVNVAGDVSPQIDAAPPRLTFFVKSNNVLSGEPKPGGLAGMPAASSASDNKVHSVVGEDELNQEGVKPKKILFNSATVIKSKPCVSPEHSPDTHKTRTFRRRLLQKAPLVPASPESNAGLLEGVSVLPVINSEACVNFKFCAAPPQESEQKLIPHRPATSTCTVVQPALTRNAEITTASSEGHASHKPVLSFQVTEDMFPVHSLKINQKKRKSDEYLRDNSECLPRSLEVKQNSVETQESKKPCHEKQFSSRCKQPLIKITGEC